MIERIYFGLPFKKYKIRAFTTRDTLMPIVDEYILRLAYVLNGVSLKTLKVFFGFTSEELSIVLSKLVTRGFVNLFEDKVILTPFAKNTFNSSASEIPTFVKVEERNYEPTFESTSFKYLEKPLDWAEGKILPVVAEIKARGKEISEVENSFIQAFPSILRKQAKGKINKFNQHESVYSVKSVTLLRYGEFMFPLDFFQGNLGMITIHSPDSLKEDTDEELIQYLKQQANKILVTKKASLDNRGLEEFIRIFGINPFIDNHKDMASIHNWYESQYYNRTSFTNYVFGSIYADENLKDFLDAKHLKFEESEKLDIYWKLPDDNQYWGTGNQPDQFLKSFIPSNLLEKTNLHIFSSQGFKNIESLFSLPCGINKEIHLFDNPFNRGLLGNGQVECLVIPGHFCAVLYHYEENNNYGVLIPFGIVSKTKDFQNKIFSMFEKLLENKGGWLTYIGKKLAEDRREYSNCKFIKSRFGIENINLNPSFRNQLSPNQSFKE